MSNILKATQSNIRKAARVILQGGLVAFPTETVYGLGANGFNPIAVAKIFEAKQRPSFNPLILHIANPEQLNDIAIVDNPLIEKLIKKFWPGPLTLVLKKKNIVPDIVTSGSDTVAVRMPMNKTALKLIELSEVPIAAPSANKFGSISPTTAQHVAIQLNASVDLILDGGKTSIGVESTIIKCTGNEFQLLRYGGLSVEDIETITGKLKRVIHKNHPDAPGQLPYHYAPAKPIKFIDEITDEDIKNKKIAGLFFYTANKKYDFKIFKILSPRKSLTEAAANLFSALYELEAFNVDLILADKFPEHGLGLAIMDRLQRAVNKYQ